MFHDNRVYVTVGGDIWWSKNEAWLKCIDATQKGDITEGGLLWSYPVERHCCSTPSVYDGLVYAADCGGMVHCVDAETGRPYWVHDAGRDMWASTLVAHGKVYIGTRGARGDRFGSPGDGSQRVLTGSRSSRFELPGEAALARQPSSWPDRESPIDRGRGRSA